jgi:hypothetical protein
VNVHVALPPEIYERFREESTEVYSEGLDWEFCVIPAQIFVRRGHNYSRVAIYVNKDSGDEPVFNLEVSNDKLQYRTTGRIVERSA